MMKRAIVFVLVAAAIMGLSTARSDLDLLREIKTIEEEGPQVNEVAKVISNAVEQEVPTCCNRCTACTEKWPPESNKCVCADLMPQCRPNCKNCVQAKDVPPSPPMYRCLDFSMPYLDCTRKCVDPPTASESIN